MEWFPLSFIGEAALPYQSGNAHRLGKLKISSISASSASVRNILLIAVIYFSADLPARSGELPPLFFSVFPHFESAALHQS